MCENQKIFSALYYSFNVVRLSVILVVGTFLLALDLSIASIVLGIEKMRKHPRHTYSRLERHATPTLHLQRLAHKELGLGVWDRCTKNVPTSQDGELLGVLDVSDEAHPRLMRADEGRKTKETRGAEDSKQKPIVVLNEYPESEQR